MNTQADHCARKETRRWQQRLDRALVATPSRSTDRTPYIPAATDCTACSCCSYEADREDRIKPVTDAVTLEAARIRIETRKRSTLEERVLVLEGEVATLKKARK